MTQAELRLLQKGLEKHAGLGLAGLSARQRSAVLRTLAASRAARLGLGGARSYPRYLEDLGPRQKSLEWAALAQALPMQASSFFRYPSQDRELVRLLGRRGRTPRRKLVLWSLGCSTGEEPYSLALLLLSRLPRLEFQLFGLDLNSDALAWAEAGLFPSRRVRRQVPARFVARGFRERRNWCEVSSALRSRVKFIEANLARDSFRGLPAPDVVVCRNVFHYLTAPAASSLLRRLHGRALSGALLLVSRRDLPRDITRLWTRVGPSIYIKSES